MSNATGLYKLVRRLGGSLGTALLELLQARREDFAQQIFAANVTLANYNVFALLNSAHDRTQALRSLGNARAERDGRTVRPYFPLLRELLLRKPRPRPESADVGVVD